MNKCVCVCVCVCVCAGAGDTIDISSSITTHTHTERERERERERDSTGGLAKSVQAIIPFKDNDRAAQTYHDDTKYSTTPASECGQDDHIICTVHVHSFNAVHICVRACMCVYALF